MSFGSVWEKLIFVAVLIAFLILFSMLRRNPQKARAEAVRGLLSEIRLNIILTDTFERQPKPIKFTTTAWQLHKKKLEFLDKPIQEDLAGLFGIALDYNQRLSAAKKARSTEKIPVDLESMKERLSRIKSGLEDWLLANVGSADQSERPSMFGGLFGR